MLYEVITNIEKALTDRIGPAGAKLHTARSRNDQVNLDFRLYLRDEADALDILLAEVQRAFARTARKYLGAVMPGYTHMQRAQPVLLSHHLLAYVEMFQRDRDRLRGCRERIDILPLGAAAMAGTGLPIDRRFVADELGFAAITANSMDTRITSYNVCYTKLLRDEKIPCGFFTGLCTIFPPGPLSTNCGRGGLPH